MAKQAIITIGELTIIIIVLIGHTVYLTSNELSLHPLLSISLIPPQRSSFPRGQSTQLSINDKNERIMCILKVKTHSAFPKLIPQGSFRKQVQRLWWMTTRKSCFMDTILLLNVQTPALEIAYIKLTQVWTSKPGPIMMLY